MSPSVRGRHGCLLSSCNTQTDAGVVSVYASRAARVRPEPAGAGCAQHTSENAVRGPAGQESDSATQSDAHTEAGNAADRHGDQKYRTSRARARSTGLNPAVATGRPG